MKTVDLAPDFRSTIINIHLFTSLLEERLVLKEQQKAIEERLKELDTSIMAEMSDSNAPKVMYGENSVSIVEGSRSTLSKERLVELGVPVTIVQQATKVTKFTYILVK